MNKVTIYKNDFEHFENRYRAQLINSITGFKNLGLVGTCNLEGQTNLAVFSSFTHLGSNPPLMSCIVRPDSVERHTLSNILETGFYTFNHVNEKNYQSAHQTSARYPREISEFDATRLSVEYLDNFKAPFVKESNIKIGLSLVQKIDIQLNGTIMLIGKIELIDLKENYISSDGYIDIEKAGTICCSGLDSYHKTTRLARLSYAKIDKDITEL